MFTSLLGPGFQPLGLVGRATFRFQQSSTDLRAHDWPDILWVIVLFCFVCFKSLRGVREAPPPRRQWIPCKGWMDQRSEVVHWKPVLRNGTVMTCSQVKLMAAWGKVFPSQLKPVRSKGFFTLLCSRIWRSMLGSDGHIFSPCCFGSLEHWWHLSLSCSL